MKKLVIATTNENKVERIKRLLEGLDYEILSIKDIDLNIPEPEENASTPVEIAIEKAIYYAKNLPEGTMILSQDDTISFEGVSEEDNPKMHIKKPVKQKYGRFTDELAAEYYTDLAKKYGGTIPMTFRYGHAIAIRGNAKREFVKVVGGESKLKVRIIDKINKLETVSGYFLAAIMQAKIDGEWVEYNELDNDMLLELDKDLYESIINLLTQINE